MIDKKLELCYSLRMTEITRPKKKVRVMNPNSLANLKPYKPGQNGHGRVYPLKERLYHALDKPLKEPKPDAPAGEKLVYATLMKAIECLPAPFHEVWDRVEGKVVQPISGADGSPLLMTMVFQLPDGRRLTAGEIARPQLKEGDYDGRQAKNNNDA